METIKIIIVDNNHFFREDFKLILESEFPVKVITIIDSDNELFEINDLKPDIIFINLAIARRNGFQTIKHFLWEYPQMKVIGINTFFSEPNYLHQLIAVGIKGCIDGDNIYNELNEAINKVMKGSVFFSRRVLETL